MKVGPFSLQKAQYKLVELPLRATALSSFGSTNKADCMRVGVFLYQQRMQNMTPGTYEIKNKLDGMAYGGRAGDIEQRWKNHLSMLRNDRHHCEYFQNAWNKYGKASFEFNILEEIEDPGERRAAEQVWLDIHHAAGTCYNIAITAGPAGPMAEETKRKIGDANRGKKRTDEWKQAHSERMTGKKHTEEANRAKSERMTGELHPMWGKHHTDASIQKMREASLGNQYSLGCKRTEEQKSAQSERMMGNQRALGYEWTDEQKEAQSLAWTPEMKAAQSERQKLLCTDEVKAAISERMMGNQNSLGRVWTDEEKRAISKRQKLLCTEEECRARSERMMGNQNSLGSKRTPEQKAAKSERMKRWWAERKAAEAEA